MRKLFGWGALIALILAGIGAMRSGLPDGEQQQVHAATAASVAVAQVDKSAELQADRKDFIQRAISQGAFKKVEVPGSLPRVWVTPRFMALDFDDKQKFISVVYAYYFDGTNITDTVRLFDSKSGKEVGRYSSTGLEIF